MRLSWWWCKELSIFPRVFLDVCALWTAHRPAYKLLRAEHLIYRKRLLHYKLISSLFTVLNKELFGLNFNYLLKLILQYLAQEKFRKLKEEEESLKGEESAKRQKIEELLRIVRALGILRGYRAELQGSASFAVSTSFMPSWAGWRVKEGSGRVEESWEGSEAAGA